MKVQFVPARKSTFVSTLRPDEFREKLPNVINKPTEGLWRKPPILELSNEGNTDSNSFTMTGLKGRLRFIVNADILDHKDGTLVELNVKFPRTDNTLINTVTFCLLIPYIWILIHILFEGKIVPITTLLFLFGISIFLYVIERLQLEIVAKSTLDFFNENLKK